MSVFPPSRAAELGPERDAQDRIVRQRVDAGARCAAAEELDVGPRRELLVERGRGDVATEDAQRAGARP